MQSYDIPGPVPTPVLSADTGKAEIAVVEEGSTVSPAGSDMTELDVVIGAGGGPIS